MHVRFYHGKGTRGEEANIHYPGVSVSSSHKGLTRPVGEITGYILCSQEGMSSMAICEGSYLG